MGKTKSHIPGCRNKFFRNLHRRQSLHLCHLSLPPLKYSTAHCLIKSTRMEIQNSSHIVKLIYLSGKVMATPGLYFCPGPVLQKCNQNANILPTGKMPGYLSIDMGFCLLAKGYLYHLVQWLSIPAYRHAMKMPIFLCLDQIL